jgi:phage terminase large subunit-like protein
LEEERLFDLKYNPIRYNHIWEGDYEPQVVGALWDRAMINQGRVEEPPVLKKTVVSVDPAISSEEHANETGIIGTGLGDNDEGYVLVDESTIGKPESWARRAVAVYELLEADCIVAESNQGGEMVRSTIKAVRPNVPVTLVHARKGKARRAEPISALYSLGRIHHVGAFPKLEDQMCLMTTEDYHGVGSPDRCDAMVHGFNYLFGPMTRPKGNPNNPRPTRTVSRAPARA